MNVGITLRPARLDDIPRIARMLAPIYRVKRSEDFYVWQFFRNTNPCVLMCAFIDGQLAGMFGIQRRVLIGGVVCGQASWINIDPKWQGKGLLGLIGREAMSYFDDLDAVCVFANSAAREACEHALGLETIGVIRTTILDTAMADLACPRVLQETVGPDFVFHELGLGDQDGFRFRHDQAFRYWRYALNPDYKYSVVSLRTGEYAVVKTFADPSSKVCYGDIVDIECRLDDDGALSTLIERAIACLTYRGAERIAIWAAPQSLLSGVLNTIGFGEGDHETYFALRLLKKGYGFLSEFGKWHLQQSDATNY